MSENKYIPIWEFAEKYGVTKQTVYRWIREGKIPKENTIEQEVVITKTFVLSSSIIGKNEKPTNN